MADIQATNTSRSYSINQNNDAARATNRGTRIVKNGSEMDKNAFLKILAAELKNQDPSNTKDSSAYVAQLAQFASMEQMANLNTTATSLNANSLIGKGVTVNSVDESGKPYTGIVRGAENRYGETILGVEVNHNGKNEVMEFSIKDVNSILEAPNTNMDSVNFNTSLLYASSMIGKKVEMEVQDQNNKNYSGIVKGVFRENGIVKISVKLEDGQVKDFPYNQVMKISEVEK